MRGLVLGFATVTVLGALTLSLISSGEVRLGTIPSDELVDTVAVRAAGIGARHDAGEEQAVTAAVSLMRLRYYGVDDATALAAGERARDVGALQAADEFGVPEDIANLLLELDSATRNRPGMVSEVQALVPTRVHDGGVRVDLAGRDMRRVGDLARSDSRPRDGGP